MAMRMSALAFCALMITGLAAAGEGADIRLFVSPAGKDSWSGTRGQPAPDRKDGPFATVARAREAARIARRSGNQVTVVLREGRYQVDSTFVLGPEDRGSAARPAIWQGMDGETVRLVGGNVVSAFREVRDPRVLARLAPIARPHVRVTDLGNRGITDIGAFPDRINLFFRGRRMSPARYPNSGWLRIATVPQSGGRPLNQGDHKVLKDGLPAGRHFGMFTYTGTRPDSWSVRTGIWMHGYWAWDWRDAYQRVERIDTATGTVYPALPHHHYGYQKGQRFCFLNVLEELDTPGEWYLDEALLLLYFWPPSAIHEGDVTVSMLRKPMIVLENTSHVHIRNLILESSRACAIRIIGGADNLVAGCTIRNIDNDTAVVINGGWHNGIRSCDIHEVGSTGIRIDAGDRRTLSGAGNFAINNHITRYGQIIHAFNGGVWLQGVGDTVAHNRIHDAPFSGIQYYGNEHVIEYNEVYDVARESGDVGGVNTGADYSEQGTLIRYNYFHDTKGPGEGGYRAVYLDLPGSGTTIEGNVFFRVDIGVFFNSGRDNIVRNNLFIECQPSVNIYRWPHMSYFRPGGAWKIVEKLTQVRFQEPPYSIKYPKLPRYLDSADLGMPYGHIVVNNVSVGGTFLDLSEGLSFDHLTVENNVIGDSMVLVVTKKWTPDYDPYHIGYASTHSVRDTSIVNQLRRRGNVIADPGVMDVAGRDFRLRPDSPAWLAGFRRIPLEKIGMYRDEYRRSDPGGIRRR